jgi:hypothetical protein
MGGEEIMGRKPSPSPNDKSITFFLTQKDGRRLKEYCRERSVEVSPFIRKLVINYLDDVEGVKLVRR